jgi:Flp pilus assembly protein TadB
MGRPARIRPGPSLAGAGARIRFAAGTTKRQFVYRWRAPRSPLGRVLVLPVLLAIAAITLVVALLVIVLMLAAAVLGVALSLLWFRSTRRAPRHG